MSTSAEPKNARLLQLDLLRGIAILLVLGRHVPIPMKETGKMHLLAGPWEHLGWTGVDLFFVLSGFLIGGLLFQELRKYGRLDVKRFLIRRGFKIWPPYFVFLAWVFVATVAFDQVGVWHTVERLLPNLLHVQNYLGTLRSHTWSLAVEEHFYLLLPFLLLLLTRRSGASHLRALPVVALTVFAVCTLSRFVALYGFHTQDHKTIISATHLRVDSLFFGVLLAYFYHYRPEVLERVTRHRGALLAFGVLLVSPMIFLRLGASNFIPTLGLTFLYVGYGCILLALLYTPVGVGMMGRAIGSRAARLLAYVGGFSYSIYLWHWDYVQALYNHVPAIGVGSSMRPELRWIVFMLLYIVGACLLGMALATLIEKPTLALRDRLFPGVARPVAAPRRAEDASPVELDTPAPDTALSPTQETA